MTGTELLLLLLLIGTFGTTALIWREVRGYRQQVKQLHEGTKKFIRGTAEREFRQIEALISLNSTMSLPYPLAVTRGWASSPDLLLTLYRAVSEKQPKVILECGSGTSTVVLAHAAARYGGRVISLDHEEKYAAATREELRRQGLTADVRTTPLVRVNDMLWYDTAVISDINGIELLFVDGPPSDTGNLARYPALPLLWDRCADSLTILLDDTIRPDEKEVSQRWLDEFPLTLTKIGLEKGAHRFDRAFGSSSE